MKISFYCIPGFVGLKFETPQERDRFHSTMTPAEARAACDRIGNRTLRFSPDRMKVNYLIGLETPLSDAQVKVPEVISSEPTATASAQMPTPNSLVNVATVADPFAFTGQNVTKALPGLVDVRSNIPPQDATVTPEVPEASTPPAPEVALEAPKVVPVTEVEPENTATPKVDLRTREGRQLKAKLKAQQKV